MMSRSFTLKKRIYYHNTDSEGVVYYADYLEFFEEARTEHLLSLGIDLREAKSRGVLFAVSALDIKYRRPARYGDSIDVISKIEKIKPASILFSHVIAKDGSPIVECSTKLVSIGADFKPAAIPESIFELLRGDAQ